ncbi:MAG: hypothetical protein WD042_19855 [Phycisphaeraceae bacterium]
MGLDHDGAARVLQALLSWRQSHQQTIWQAARGNANLPQRDRYAPGLSPEDKAKLQKAADGTSDRQARGGVT